MMIFLGQALFILGLTWLGWLWVEAKVIRPTRAAAAKLRPRKRAAARGRTRVRA